MREMICIEYPKTKAGKRQWGKEYGMNAIYAGKHWSRRKADSEYWHSLTHAALVRAGIPRNPAQKPVSIDFWWDDRLDLDNHAYMAKMIVDEWLAAEFEGGRHQRRVDMIMDIENR